MEIGEIKDVLMAVDDHEERDYLGMSAIGQCPLKLYHDLVDGRQRPKPRRLWLFHEGYVHERDVVERLRDGGVEVVNCGREVWADFDERLRGHIDGEIDGDLLEVKSVTEEGFADVRRAGPFVNHREQVQLYMRYGGYERAVLVYKCRVNGDMWLFEVRKSKADGERLERKARMVLDAVDDKDPPECTCGRCWR